MVEQRHRSLAAEAGAVSANTIMVVLGCLWNFAGGRIPDLPTSPVRRLRRQWYPQRRRTRHVRADQMAAFYAALQKAPNAIARDLILLMLFTGTRFGEASSLTWDDVDFTAMTIRIPGERTKTGEALALPMVDVVHSMLVARRSIGRARFVFPGNSAVGHVVDVRGSFAHIAAATNITVSAHDLRRTYITVAESCDISLIALKALVNHSLGRGITEGYVQMTPDRLREPAQKVCDKLKVLCGVPAPGDTKVARLRR